MANTLHTVLLNGEAGFLRLILDSVSDCLVVVDVEGRIALINKPYCQLLGGLQEDFLGRSVRDVISPVSQLEMVARGGKPLVTELLTVRGQQIVTRQVPIKLDGKIIGAIGVALFATSHLASATLRSLLGNALVLRGEASSQWRARYSIDDIVGRGAEIVRLKAEIRQAARNELPALVQGETGTGKELVAQAIHNLSSRACKPFVWVNCATIPPELVASELFGYEAGAFTGSNMKGSRGKLELAHDGTLFLDEIGDMPLHAQAALLRFLQEGEITRVGGAKPMQLNVRVISASHKDLPAMVQKGAFREDLLYRLQVLEISTPPLRQRTDFEVLVNHLIAKTQLELALARLSISARALAQLRSHVWPGNIRELIARLRRAAAALPENVFEIDSFEGLKPCDHATLLTKLQMPTTLAEIVKEAERKAIDEALRATGGNRSAAAERLGIDRTSFYKRLNAHGMQANARAL